jgi:hypothetical protein
LTDERWRHIVDTHPEMDTYEEHLKATIQTGARRQEPLSPRKYRYAQSFPDLLDNNTHVIAVVVFKFDVNEQGQVVENNLILTAYQQFIRQKR